MAKKVETGSERIRELENQLVAIAEKLDSIDTSVTVAKTGLGGEPYVVQNYNFPSRESFALAGGWPSKKFKHCNFKEIYRHPQSEPNDAQIKVTLNYENMPNLASARVFVDDSGEEPNPTGGREWKKDDAGLGQPISDIDRGKSVWIHYSGQDEVEIFWHVS